MLSRGVRIYPWAKRDNPPATRYLTPDPDKIVQFLNPPRGMEYWERLAAAIQREPVEDRDRFFMAMLMPLGIEKGKPFQPDARQKKILTEGVFVGEAMVKASSFDTRLTNLCYRNTLWIKPLMATDPIQDLANYSELDQRAAYTYYAVMVTAGMRSETPGAGQAYLACASATRRGMPSMVRRGTACACRRIPLRNSSGRSHFTTRPPAHSSRTRSNARTVPPGMTLLKTRTGTRRRVLRIIGFPPCPATRGSRLSGFTRRWNLTSTKAGRCRTSRDSPNSSRLWVRN